MNPFLGGGRSAFAGGRPIFRTQLRAILRASAEGNIKMMYPMISGLDELIQANGMVESASKSCARKEPLRRKSGDRAMVEIPSAVMIADALAKRLKF